MCFFPAALLLVPIQQIRQNISAMDLFPFTISFQAKWLPELILARSFHCIFRQGISFETNL